MSRLETLKPIYFYYAKCIERGFNPTHHKTDIALLSEKVYRKLPLGGKTSTKVTFQMKQLSNYQWVIEIRLLDESIVVSN